LTDITGTNLGTLRLVCALTLVLGTLAVRLGRREEQELQQTEGRDK
jgi:hypothetical protein